MVILKTVIFKTNPFNLVAIFIALSLLSSCSITKCRYSNGFNIDFRGKSKVPIAVKKAKIYNTITEAKPISERDTINDEESISLNQKTLNTLGENSDITTQKAPRKNIPIRNLKKTIKETKSKINKTSVKAFIQAQKPNKTNSILHTLWKIIKFIFFLCLCVAVMIAMGIVAALLIASAFSNDGAILIVLLIGIAGLAILVLILGLIYQLFGYGPAQDVYDFCMSVFGVY
ncbi:MAG: hypothetical protein Q8K70_04450 [Bacteroidota bacterium]|nr:hypothetical protein [Bacteroidota bacterium]